MKRHVTVLILFFLCIALYAEGSGTAIRFVGLKKTKEAYLLNVLKDFAAQDADDVDLHDVETVLQAEGVFSEVHVELAEEQNSSGADDSVSAADTAGEGASLQKYILITVKEKITFIPLPFASYSSDGFMGGFMLMNMNAFGKKNTVVAGGIFRPTMQMGMLTFAKPAVDSHRPGFSMFGSVSNREQRFSDFDDDELCEFDSLSATAAFSVSEKLTRSISLRQGVSYNMCEAWSNNVPSVHQWLTSAGFTWSSVNWNGWYLLSNSFSVEGEAGYSSQNEIIRSYSVRSTLQIPFVPRLRGVLNLSGALDVNKHDAFQSGKGSIGSSILYSDFKTPKIAGAGFNLEGALFRKKIATFSLYTSYECAVAEDADGSAVFAHGPGAGARVYLQQIAFPAVVMGASYNVTQNLWQYVISVGMSF